MGFPPLLLGAVQLNVTCLSPSVTMRFRGMSGTVLGFAVVDAEIPAPAAFTALTLNVYDWPFDKLKKVCTVLRFAVTHVEPLSLDTSYRVIALPPLLDGAVHLNATSLSPGDAVKFCGALGGLADVVAVPVTQEL